MADEEITETPISVRESVIIKLTRMEGKLDNLTEKIKEMHPRVEKNTNEIGQLGLRTQSLEDGSVASVRTAEALAKALREAKETAEGAAAAEITKTTMEKDATTAAAALGWSPITKLFAVIAAFGVGYAIFLSITGG